MTPFQIAMILRWYGTVEDPADMMETSAGREALDHFRNVGLIVRRHSSAHGPAIYELTPRGNAYVRGLMALPLPSISWEFDWAEAEASLEKLL